MGYTVAAWGSNGDTDDSRIEPLSRFPNDHVLMRIEFTTVRQLHVQPVIQPS